MDPGMNFPAVVAGLMMTPAMLLFQYEDPSFRMTARNRPSYREADYTSTDYSNIVSGHLGFLKQSSTPKP